MNYILSNEKLTATFSDEGAEIKSIIDNATSFEFMWQGDPFIWGRTSPILFPIVGKLKGNSYRVNDHSYILPQHGFARDMIFDCESANQDELVFKLCYNQISLNQYPFQFELLVTYTLLERSIKVTWAVKNLGSTLMYYSIGAHPGFNLKNEQLDDYSIEFESLENDERMLLTDGLFDHRKKLIGMKASNFDLTATHFEDDAIVLFDIRSSHYSLVHKKSKHRINFNAPFHKYLGIWGKKGCTSFVCIEPWQGHADFNDSTGEIAEKSGIITLPPQQEHITFYEMTFMN